MRLIELTLSFYDSKEQIYKSGQTMLLNPEEISKVFRRHGGHPGSDIWVKGGHHQDAIGVCEDIETIYRMIHENEPGRPSKEE